MPINSSVVTDDMFDSLPLVSEVLENKKSGQETPTKELKNETKNDKIEANNGMLVSVPASKLEAWIKAQEEEAKKQPKQEKTSSEG